LCCTTAAYLKTLPYWHNNWDGALASPALIPLLISLLFISAGLGAAWDRSHYAGMVPLFGSAAYTLGNALARNSGWRYNLPVDWVGMLFYSIGVVQLGFWIVTYFKDALVPRSWITKPQELTAVSHFPWIKAALLAAGFVVLVASIPLAEHFIPDRYQALTPESALASLYASQSGGGLSANDRDLVEAILKEENAVALVGRVLYPRFLHAGEGAISPSWPNYQVQDYPHLGFIHLGPERESVILRMDQPPDYFPNAADSLVVGCRRENYIDARLVAILDDTRHTIVTSTSQPWDCELP
jgi:hypothetical protein